jgi:hypothetical protein
MENPNKQHEIPGRTHKAYFPTEDTSQSCKQYVVNTMQFSSWVRVLSFRADSHETVCFLSQQFL